jgi:hypothetical protein
MKILCTLLLAFIFVIPRGWAQQAAESDGGDDMLKETQSDLLIITGAGAAGAVLGLSTLSFYDKPSKHLSNIWMGAAVGIIAGVILVAVNHAQKTEEEMAAAPDFGAGERHRWHAENAAPTYQPHTLASAPLWAGTF